MSVILSQTVGFIKFSGLNLGCVEILVRNDTTTSIFKTLVYLIKHTVHFTQVPPTSRGYFHKVSAGDQASWCSWHHISNKKNWFTFYCREVVFLEITHRRCLVSKQYCLSRNVVLKDTKIIFWSFSMFRLWPVNTLLNPFIDFAVLFLLLTCLPKMLYWGQINTFI